MTDCRFQLWECLPAHKQKELAAWYGRHFHRKFLAPGHRPEVEPPEEIDRIMRETGKEVKP